MNRTESIVRDLQGQLRTFYGRRLWKILLFGSHARGDAAESSDIDVLVVLKGDIDSCAEVDRTISITAPLCLENDVVISCVFISDDDYNNRQSPFLMNVRREGVFL